MVSESVLSTIYQHKLGSGLDTAKPLSDARQPAQAGAETGQT